MSWNDFNDAEQQQSFDLIPRGTLARVRMTIKPGGFDDPTQGWSGGYATESFETGAVFLSCELVVIGGEFDKRKLWSNIGLFSPKGDAWANMGRSFIRAILNSARGVLPSDVSPQAQAARRIADFSALDGIEFAARIDVEKDTKGEQRNIIKQAIEPDHKAYAGLMGGHAPLPPGGAPSTSANTTATPSRTTTTRTAAPAKPAWAQ